MVLVNSRDNTVFFSFILAVVFVWVLFIQREKRIFAEVLRDRFRGRKD
jgi:hypothetical protein